MEIVTTNTDDPKASFFEYLCKIEWPDNFARDFRRGLIGLSSPMKLFLCIDDGLVVGGCLISKRIINTFKNPKKNDLAEKLKEKDYYNLTYVVFHPKYRRKKYGHALMEHVLQEYNKVWIDAVPRVEEWYAGMGFDVESPRDDQDDALMSYHKK